MLQLFLDDNVRNVAAGKALGLRTALVNLPINPLVVKSKKKIKNHTNPLLESNLPLATEIQIKKSANLANFLLCTKKPALFFYHLEKEENARGSKAQESRPLLCGAKRCPEKSRALINQWPIHDVNRRGS
jgi:hypothetical protein